MKFDRALVPLALALFSTWASAQAPIFIALPPGVLPTDVSVSQANGLVVVGTQPGGAFRWTPTSGVVSMGLTIGLGSTVRISSDGSTIVGDENLSPTVTSRWLGGVFWSPIPGLGGTSSGGGEESTVGEVNADGTVIVGMGYSSSNIPHAYRWNLGVGTTDLGPWFNSPTSRATGVSGDGTLVVGWQQGAMAMGVRWLNGALSIFNYVDPSNVSHFVQQANAVNHSGSIVVGKTIYGVSGSAWRWDSGTNAVSLLGNLPGNGLNPIPLDLTDDGSLIVGNDGGTTLFAARRAVIWVNGQAKNPLVHFSSLGMATTGFTELGNMTAVSRDGSAFVGAGIAGGAGQPEGWVILFPHLLPIGAPVCSGDGTAAACPCGNSGGSGRGCANSTSAVGAELTGTGVASITTGQDSLVLSATDVSGPGLFFQATTLTGSGTGTPFGDGLLCLTGAILRMGVVFPTAGVAMYPGGLTPQPIHVAGGPLNAGDVRHYQCWYRDAIAFCSSSTFNLTQALTLTWTP